MADSENDLSMESESVNSVIEHFKGMKSVHKAEMLKLATKEKELLEKFERQKVKFLRLQERYHEIFGRVYELRFGARYLKSVLHKWHGRSTGFFQTLERLEKEKSTQLEDFANEQLRGFEEQMMDVVALINDAKEHYTEENLKNEKQQLLIEYKEEYQHVVKVKEQIADILELVTNTEADISNVNEETEIFETELDDVFWMLKAENEKSRLAVKKSGATNGD